MIVHCMTKEQIEDVIKIDGLNVLTTPETIFNIYGINSCIDEGSYGSLVFYKSYGYTITPYSDWKLIQNLDTKDNKCIKCGEYKTGIEMFNKIKYYEESAKMKEMYSLSGKFYGIFGESTDMTYEDGSIIHTGDIVESFCDNKSYGLSLACNDGDNYGVMGVFSRKFTNGKANDWSIKLVCKYYDNNEEKVDSIIIKHKQHDQFIQLEGGKLNITKAKRLGLWKEDKKVFTIDKDCEIECEDYEVFSTSSLFNEDRLIIMRKNGIEIVRLVKPTSDKVRHEFAYYGIDVDVK